MLCSVLLIEHSGLLRYFPTSSSVFLWAVNIVEVLLTLGTPGSVEVGQFSACPMLRSPQSCQTGVHVTFIISFEISCEAVKLGLNVYMAGAVGYSWGAGASGNMEVGQGYLKPLRRPQRFKPKTSVPESFTDLCLF